MMRSTHWMAACALLSACGGLPTDSAGDGHTAFAKTAAGPAITAASPDNAPQDTTLDIHVLGSGFDDSSRIDPRPQRRARSG